MPALGAIVAAGVLAGRIGREVTRRVQGDSMRPVLRPGDLIVVLPTATADLRRGDVVVLRDPREPSRETVKRVVGVPGDWADVPDGPALVAPGYLEVRGDDPTRSTDSRTYGTVPVGLVVGRVVARVWPRPMSLSRRAGAAAPR